MKKIFLPIFAAGMLFTSCDMDLKPEGVVDTTTAITNVSDCRYFRNGLYSTMRSLGCGGNIGNTEIQMDQFNAITTYGNRGGVFSNAQITSGLSDITVPYAGLYSAINRVLFLLENAEPMLENAELSAAELSELKLYIGEAKFARAYFYFYLMDHYCQSYSPDKGAQEGLGLSIVEKFNPTGDTSAYPGRSSMDAVISLIDSDLTAALSAIEAYEKAGHTENCAPNAPYLSSWTVKAFKARVALVTGNNGVAKDTAKDIIEHGPYSLTTGQDYVDMWSNDAGSELLFVPAVPKSEYSTISSTNEIWNYWPLNQVSFIPSPKVIELYDAGDIRLKAFYDLAFDISVEGESYAIPLFNKFPGNNAIINGTDYYKNKPKPFRLSEQYLILAEAAALSNDLTTANNALNDLRKARISDYVDETFNAAQIINEIRDERSRELIGEGFRMSDLRRWNLGFKRDGVYDDVPAKLLVSTGLDVEYIVGDYRYVWPIPSDEMEINPQLKGQQNPGY